MPDPYARYTAYGDRRLVFDAGGRAAYVAGGTAPMAEPLVPPGNASSLRVTHCICTNKELAPLVTRYPNLAAIEEATHCGRYCGMCTPYIEALLAARQSGLDSGR